MGLFNFSLKRWAEKASVWLLAVLAAVSLMLAMAAANPQTARAAEKMDTMTPESIAQAFVYYKAIRSCFVQATTGAGGLENATLGTISQNGANNYTWFYSGFGAADETNVGLLGDPRPTGNGQHRCYGEDQGVRIAKELVRLTGYSTGAEFLCAIGFTRQTANSEARCANIVEGVTNDFKPPSDLGTKLDTWWTGTVGATSLNAGGLGPGQYMLYYQSFTDSSNPCGVDLVQEGEEEFDYEIMAPSADGKRLVPTKYIIVDSGKNRDSDIQLYDQLVRDCKDVVADLSTDSSAVSKFREWLRESDDHKFTGVVPKVEGGDEGDTTSCAIDGIGWLICPVITFAASIADGMFVVLADNFLKVGVSVVNSDPNAGPTTTYDAWRAMQTIANVILVIGFLIIIFSQLTGAGISNYGVKKMLPRLIIVAILINISFVVCQIAVDISNILGYSIRDFFSGIAAQATAGNVEAYNSSTGNVLGGTNGWTNIAGGVLVGVGVIAAGYFMLSALGTVLLAVILALAMIIFILIARQAIIVLAIVVAPVALALYLLPNTENLTKQWWKIFSRMLLLFPIIALLFGASTLAAVVLRDSFGSVVADNENVNWFGQIMAAGIQVLPLFATPLVLKGALNAVPLVGNLASKLSGRANAGLGKKFGESYNKSTFGRSRAVRKQERENYRTQKYAEGLTGDGRMSRLRRAVAGGVAITESQKRAKQAIARAAHATVEEAETKDVSAAEKLMQSRVTAGADAGVMLEEALKNGDRVQAKAAQNILFKQGGSGVDKFRQIVSQAEGSLTSEKQLQAAAALRENISTNHGQYIKSKGLDLVKWAAKGGVLAEVSAATETWANSSSTDLVGQTGEALYRAAAAGAINPEQARDILEDPRLSAQLDAKQRDALAYATYYDNVRAPAADPQPPAPAAPTVTPVDSQGRQTPPDTNSPDDYHDGMAR